MTPQLPPTVASEHYVVSVQNSAGRWFPFARYDTELRAVRYAHRLRSFGWIVRVRRMEALDARATRSEAA